MKVMAESFHLNGHIIGYSSADSKVRVNLQNSIKYSGSKRVNWGMAIIYWPLYANLSLTPGISTTFWQTGQSNTSLFQAFIPRSWAGRREGMWPGKTGRRLKFYCIGVTIWLFSKVATLIWNIFHWHGIFS